MDLSAVPNRTDRYTIRVVGGCTVFVSPRGDELHKINELGTFIFSLVDGNRSLGRILDSICDEYAVEPDVAQRDLVIFASDLESRGLIITEVPSS